MADFFEAVDTRLKIYRSKGRLKQITTSHPTALMATDTRSRELKDRMAGVRRAIRSAEEENILERYLNIITEHFISLAVIVNENMEVLQIMGESEGYFKLPSGKLVNDISKMAVKKLIIPLTTGISKTFRQRQEVRFSNIALITGSVQRTIDLRILPMPEKRGQEPLAAVFITEIKKADAIENKQTVQTFDLSRETEEHFKELEQELQFTRENLQATIEELETSNEELQATNEELLASNEELQSTNEELQSTNEELFTVNAEYQSKIIELTELHNDLDNLMASSQIGQILLDENMELRRFSRGVSQIFKILNGDIGRPITHIYHNLVNIDLVAIIQQVQQDGKPIEREVLTHDRNWYIMKIVPYAVAPKVFSGTIISFDNVIGIKETHAALQESNQKSKILFETLSQGIVYQAKSGEITAANPAAERILGLSLDQMMGRKSIDPRWQALREDGSPFPGEEHPSMVALRTGKEIKGTVMGVFNPTLERVVWINVSAVPQFRPGDSEPFEVHTTFDDITDHIQSLDNLRESEEHYRQLFNEMPNGFAIHEIICDEKNIPVDYRFIKVNRAFEEIVGLKAKHVIGKTVLQIFPGIESSWIERYGKVALTGESIKFEDYSQVFGKRFEVRAFCYAPRQFAVIFCEINHKEC